MDTEVIVGWRWRILRDTVINKHYQPNGGDAIFGIKCCGHFPRPYAHAN